MKKTVYIAGKVSDLPVEQYQLKFEQASKTISEQGFEVYNPVQIIQEKYGETHLLPWSECMKEVLPYVIKADVVVLLPCWVHSRGAKIEFQLAKELGIPCIESTKDLTYRLMNKLY